MKWRNAFVVGLAGSLACSYGETNLTLTVDFEENGACRVGGTVFHARSIPGTTLAHLSPETNRGELACYESPSKTLPLILITIGEGPIEIAMDDQSSAPRGRATVLVSGSDRQCFLGRMLAYSGDMHLKMAPTSSPEEPRVTGRTAVLVKCHYSGFGLAMGKAAIAS